MWLPVSKQVFILGGDRRDTPPTRWGKCVMSAQQHTHYHFLMLMLIQDLEPARAYVLSEPPMCFEDPLGMHMFSMLHYCPLHVQRPRCKSRISCCFVLRSAIFRSFRRSASIPLVLMMLKLSCLLKLNMIIENFKPNTACLMTAWGLWQAEQLPSNQEGYCCHGASSLAMQY